MSFSSRRQLPSCAVTYRAVAIDRAGAVFNIDGAHPISRYEAWSDLEPAPPRQTVD